MSSRLANLRDVAAGLPLGSVRPGLLFRSDAPQPGDEPPTLLSWPPAVVIDLRDPAELDVAHPLVELAGFHSLPLLRAAAPDAARGAGADHAGLATIYAAMLRPRPAAQLVRIVALAAAAAGPVLVHCAAGKDRTGVTIAFLLRLLGVENDAILDEFALTDAMRLPLYRRLQARFGFPDVQSAAEIPPELLQSSREALAVVLGAWSAHEDGAEGWYLAQGGDAVALVQLRARLLPRAGCAG